MRPRRILRTRADAQPSPTPSPTPAAIRPLTGMRLDGNANVRAIAVRFVVPSSWTMR